MPSWRPEGAGRPSGVEREALEHPVLAFEPGGDAEAHHRGGHDRQGQDPRGQERHRWVTPAGLGRTSTSEKKTSSPTGMPRVSSTDSPRRRVMVTSARVCACQGPIT